MTRGAAVTLASNTRASAQAEAADPAAPARPGAAAYPAPPYPIRDAALARPRLEDEPAARPWRDELQGLGQAGRKKALITGGDSGIGRPRPSRTLAKGPTLPSTTCRPKIRTRRKWSP